MSGIIYPKSFSTGPVRPLPTHTPVISPASRTDAPPPAYRPGEVTSLDPIVVAIAEEEQDRRLADLERKIAHQPTCIGTHAVHVVAKISSLPRAAIGLKCWLSMLSLMVEKLSCAERGRHDDR
jgi:uncharacterized coiled-coil protein SlyX